MGEGNASRIEAGAGALNRWRSENSGSGIEAPGHVFSKIDLSGGNLEKANLSGSAFVACDLRSVRFAGAQLTKAHFSNCKLNSASFEGADLAHASFEGGELDGANFRECKGLSRLSALSVPLGGVAPAYDDTALPWIDRNLRWDRLRFVAGLRLFVPAYASLAISVLALNGFAWLNGAIAWLNLQLVRIGGSEIASLPLVQPSWVHFAVVANFFLLAVAATSFLACPPRILEFSRERWVYELGHPEFFYDHAAWRRPIWRGICAGSLALGGALSAFLLLRAITKQIVFIVTHAS